MDAERARREIRERLAAREADIEARRAELADPASSENFKQHISSISGALKGDASHACTHRELNLDSEICVKTAEVLGERIKAIHSGFKQWTSKDFASKIKRKYADIAALAEEEAEFKLNWRNVGQVARKYFRTTPAMSFMLGPLSLQPKQKAMRQKHIIRGKDEAVKVTTTERILSSSEQKQKSEAEQRLSHMSNVVLNETKARGGVNLFELAVNPQSFAQSVENLFDLSFMVNSGEVELSLHQNQPWLQTRYTADNGVKKDVHGNEMSEDPQGSRPLNDLIIKFDMSMHEAVHSAYKLENCRLGHRSDPSLTNDGGSMLWGEDEADETGYEPGHDGHEDEGS
eukprot:tig00000217_g19159.t1